MCTHAVAGDTSPPFPACGSMLYAGAAAAEAARAQILADKFYQSIGDFFKMLITGAAAGSTLVAGQVFKHLQAVVTDGFSGEHVCFAWYLLCWWSLVSNSLVQAA